MMNYDELIKENMEKIIELAREAEFEAMSAPSNLRGWTIDVVMDEDGNIDLEGPRSVGEVTLAEWEGRDSCLYSATCAPFDMDYAVDYVDWPDSMITFVEEHANENGDYEFCINGELVHFDEPFSEEVIEDFKREIVNSMDIEYMVKKNWGMA